MEKEKKIDEIFIERIKETNIFNKREERDIIINIKLYEKCYILGLLDGGR